MKNSIKINNIDNVMVALTPLFKGQTEGDTLLLEDIAQGHKFAIKDIKKGEPVIKYGMPIGTAKADIPAGSHIHTHNISTNLNDELIYEYLPEKIAAAAKKRDLKINVFHRGNGQIGIRNELWIVPTVGCVNSQAKMIEKQFKLRYPDLAGIDGVHSLCHPYGCSQMGDDHERTKKILQQFALHPNAGGVMVLGLGCENNRIDVFQQGLGDFDHNRIKFLSAQQVEDEIEAGVELLRQLYDVAKNDIRQPADISRLNVALKCGGSDGLSGITANPLLGLFCDTLTACGGTAVMTEVPEMFGAETTLMARAKDKKVFDKIVSLINNFKHYFKSNDQPVYENPSPGNKEGGITTLEDKSLGCTQKAGSSEVVDVLFEGEQIREQGLNLLWGPGNDIVACTNLAAAGCHLILFTTGRGTPLGSFVPTVKVSTNSTLANKKSNWIDFDAGTIVYDGDFDAKTEELLEYVIEVAGGKQTQNEVTDSRDLAIFKTGITL